MASAERNPCSTVATIDKSFYAVYSQCSTIAFKAANVQTKYCINGWIPGTLCMASMPGQAASPSIHLFGRTTMAKIQLVITDLDGTFLRPTRTR